jgi:predicted nucleic acid-binding protein
MKLFAVDASVAVKWFIPDAAEEAHVEQALQLLAAGEREEAQFLQPPHWIGEVTAVLVRRTPRTVNIAVEALLELEFAKTSAHARFYQRAIILSQTLNHHLFDTLYHAVALEENATLITADRRYYDKAKAVGGIMMLEEFTTKN